MVEFTINLRRLPIDTDNAEINQLNQRRNEIVDSRIENLRLQYETIVPQELQTRFIITGRVMPDTTIDEFESSSMENVSDELWQRIQDAHFFF